jgi:hypothetical protein
METRFAVLCLKGKLLEAQQLLQLYPDIEISIYGEWPFRNACLNGHLHVAQWLLEVSNQDIDISANNEEAFHLACSNGHLEVAKWLQSLKPHLYVIYYNENGEYKDYYIRTKEEANWQKRKYLVWLASNECPEENKNNLLYKLPSDVSRMVIEYV